MDLPVYLVSRGKRNQTATMLFDARIPFTLVTHEPKNLRDFIATCGFKPERTIFTRKEGVLASRNRIMAETTPNGWYLSFDDDILGMSRLHHVYREFNSLPVDGPPPIGFNSWRDVYNGAISMRELFSAACQLVKKCEAENTVLGGFATIENPMYRRNHWARIRSVATGAHVFQCRKGKGEIRAMRTETMHDQWISFKVIEQHGSVVVDNYTHVKFKPFMNPVGIGLGTFAERLPQMKGEHRQLLEEFAGLAKYAEVPNIKYASRSRVFVERWRAGRQHG